MKDNEDRQGSRSFIQSSLDAISWSLDISEETYVYGILVSSVVLAILMTLVGSVVEPFSVTVANVILIAIGWFSVIAAVFYPYIIRSEESKNVRENFHLFITYFSALSLSNVNRMQVFRKVGNEESHGIVSREMARVVTLVDTWNMSLSQACLNVSKNTSSDLLKGFLERLSHNVDAGSGLEDFLKSEQEPIMEKYRARYKADLDRIELFSESYLSLMIGLTFATVFSMIAPFLGAFDATTIVGGLLGAFIIAQLLFALLLQSLSPEDHLWYRGSTSSSDNTKKKVAIYAGTILTLVAIVIRVLLFVLGDSLEGYIFFLSIWIVTLPSLISGLYVIYLESRVMGRNDKYPGLIRSLGSTESIKRASTRSVLRDLKNKDFGELSVQINNLYRRLSSRTAYDKAWNYFSADTGSFLISRFTDMYQTGRYLGANTEELGDIISSNFETVLQLREHRRQTTSTLVGLIYGVIAVSSFAFFVTLEVVQSISSFGQEINIDPRLNVIQFAGYDIGQIQVLIITALFLTSLSSGIIVKITERRSYGIALFHFSLLFLVAMISGIAVEFATQYIDVL